MVARFEREAMAAAHLNIPTSSLRPTLEPRTKARCFWFWNLSTANRCDDQLNFGPLSPARVIHIARQVASALQRAHPSALSIATSSPKTS